MRVGTAAVLWEHYTRARDTVRQKVYGSVNHRKKEEGACKLSDKIAVLAERLERADIAEFIEFYKRPGRVIYVSFIGGLARGLGIAIGTTLLFALVFYLLTFVVRLNLPLISRVIAEVVDLVQRNLKTLETLR